MNNIDDMAREAMSRVSYATAANAEWQKKKVAEEFARLRMEKNAPVVITGTTSVTSALYSMWGGSGSVAAQQQQMADLMRNASQGYGLRMYSNQVAGWNTSNLISDILGGYR